MWRWAVFLVEGPQDFFAKQIICNGIKRCLPFYPRVTPSKHLLQLITELGGRYGFLVIGLFTCMLFLGLIFGHFSENPEGIGR